MRLVLKKVVMVVIIEKVLFEQRLEGAWGGAMHILEEVLDIGNSKDKGSSMAILYANTFGYRQGAE